MRIPLLKRLTIALCNIFFPPLAVALLTGPTSRDTFLNACLFLLAVIPSHVHGFYISAVYFTRKRRVRKGVWPGKLKRGVWSEKVLTGGVGWEEAEVLKRRGDRNGDGEESDFDNGRRRERRRSRREGERRGSRQGSRSRRNSRRASRVQSRVREPVETRTEIQETEQITITNDETRNARTSRWVEGL